MAQVREAGDAAWILYDGECPFCSHYIRMLRLRRAVGEVATIDARLHSPQRREAVAAGLDPSRGMVLKLAGRLYHGADCLHRLALLTSPISPLNRLTARLFASPRAARLLYPLRIV